MIASAASRTGLRPDLHYSVFTDSVSVHRPTMTSPPFPFERLKLELSSVSASAGTDAVEQKRCTKLTLYGETGSVARTNLHVLGMILKYMKKINKKLLNYSFVM